MAPTAAGGFAAAGEKVDADDPIQELLDARAAAVAAGDLDAWLRAIDPEAPAGFVDEQRRSFEGLRSVGVEQYRLDVEGDDTGDLSPPGLSDRYGADTYLPATEVRYRVTGYDDHDTVETVWWTYVERDGTWFIGGDADLEVVGIQSARNLWDFGPVVSVRTDRVLVLSHPERADRAQQIATLTGQALERLDTVFTRPWSKKVVVVVPSAPDEVERILQTTLDLDNFVAFVSYDSDREEGYEVTAPRMYLQDQRLSQRSETFQFDTLVHELVHAASAASAGPFVDSWVHEGLAEWVATGRPAALPVPSGSDGDIPLAFEFRAGTLDEIIRSYDEATSIMSYIAATFGNDAPFAYFEALGAQRVVPGDTNHHTDAVLESQFGVDRDQLAEDWSGVDS